MTDESASVVSLQAHLEARIDALEERLNERLKGLKDSAKMLAAAHDVALNKAETAADKRFDSVNEFRKQLADQVTTFVQRAEYAVQHKALEERIDAALSATDTRIGVATTRIAALEQRDSANVASRGRVDVMQIFTALSSVAAIVSVIFVLLTRH